MMKESSENVSEGSCSKNDDEQGDKEEIQPVGDVIGDTAYSQRFVLNTLINLTLYAIPNDEFIEKDLCVLWDMTAERDVSLFLLKHDALDLFNNALSTNGDINRFCEVLIGIIANMCCFKEVILQLNNKDNIINAILPYIKSDDSLILVQTLRFVFSNIFNDHQHFDEWLDHLENNQFVTSLVFIMENSVNEPVLSNAFETLNCICSASLETNKKGVFPKMFINENVVRSTFIAISELSQYYRKNINVESCERCNILFLSIHSILADDDELSLDAYIDNTNELLRHVCCIMKYDYTIKNKNIGDIAEYVIAIISSLNCPYSEEAVSIFLAMNKMLTDTYDILEECKSEGDDTKKIEIIATLVQYFIRIVKLWPNDKVRDLFHNIEDKYVDYLKINIEKMLENGSIDNYYKDVCLIIESMRSKNEIKLDS